MPLNPTSLQRNFIIVQENQPTSPFEGQIWVRSSDGATFQYFNGEFEQIGSEPDENTIEVNENGQLEVKKPSKLIIGDYEESNPYEITKTALSQSLSLNDTESKRGDKSVKFTATVDDAEAEAETTVNVPESADTLHLWAKCTETENGGQQEIYFDEFNLISYSDGTWGWEEATLDVSDISGEKKIKIVIGNISFEEPTSTVLIDYVWLDFEKNVVVSEEAGN